MHAPRSPLSGRQVLVTGCTGFLGSATVGELLARGVAVVGLVRDRTPDSPATHVHVVRGRVEDEFRLYTALAVYDVAAVFHLATADPGKPDRGTTSVLEAVARLDPQIPVVIARPAEAPPFPAKPPVPVGIARFGEVFGGGDRNVSRIIPSTVIGLLTGDRAAIAGDTIERDFVFVRDAARAIVALGEALVAAPNGAIRNVPFRSGWQVNGSEIAATVRDVFDGEAVKAESADPPTNPFGWRPAGPLTDALSETIAWYRTFLRTRLFGARPIEPQRRAA